MMISQSGARFQSSRLYIYDINSMQWVPFTTSDPVPGSADVRITGDAVGLARQNQLPASLGAKTSANSLSITLASDELTIPVTTANFALRLDDTSTANVTYVGTAPTGTDDMDSDWQIKKIDETSGIVITWADGNDNFDNIWDNRLSLTYT